MIKRPISREFDRLSVIGQRLFCLHLGQVYNPPVVIGSCIIRVDLDGLLVALQGLLHLSKPFLHISQGRIELRIGRFQLQRLLIIGLGLFILLQSLVSAAPLPVKPLVPRWQFDCPGEVKDSFVIQLHSGKAQAPIAVHLRSLL